MYSYLYFSFLRVEQCWPKLRLQMKENQRFFSRGSGSYPGYLKKCKQVPYGTVHNFCSNLPVHNFNVIFSIFSWKKSISKYPKKIYWYDKNLHILIDSRWVELHKNVSFYKAGPGSGLKWTGSATLLPDTLVYSGYPS